jgi:hypothetical protein
MILTQKAIGMAQKLDRLEQVGRVSFKMVEQRDRLETRIINLQSKTLDLVPWNAVMKEWFPNVGMQTPPPFSKEVEGRAGASGRIVPGSKFTLKRSGRLENS